MPHETLTIATRQSPLALWQAQHVRDELLKHWPDLDIRLLPLTTSGDKFLKDRLQQIGGKGLFVKELEEALLDKRADLAVHSMKDVPVSFPEGLGLFAICKREDPFDAFLSNDYASLHDLPIGARVGTASLRRQSQLLSYRPDLLVAPLRGNINTRIAKMQSGDYAGIILAVAGLVRMTLQTLIKQRLNPAIMLPACGQGALGIEIRENDERVKALITPLNDPITALCVQTERQVNARLGGNCHTPLAVFCTPIGHAELKIQAKVTSSDGKIVIGDQQEGPQHLAETLAASCVQSLLDQGAQSLFPGNQSP